MRGSWPGYGSGVVDHQREVAAAGLGIPALVPLRDLPGCGAEAEDGEDFAVGGPDEVAHLRTGPPAGPAVLKGAASSTCETNALSRSRILKPLRPDWRRFPNK